MNLVNGVVCVVTVMGLGSLCFDYRNSMEPEPGRCRRTDGKKWRCSRDVVPGQKYCERHVHRGRGRSRKPVEGTGAASTAAYAHVSSNPSQIQANDNGIADTGNNSSSTDRVSPPRLGFSPISVLQNAGVCRTGQVN